MVAISCPACERKYNLAESASGKSVMCKCGTKFKVPFEQVEFESVDMPDLPNASIQFESLDSHGEVKVVSLLVQVVGYPIACFGLLAFLPSLAEPSVLSLALPAALVASGLVLAGFGHFLKLVARIQNDTQRTRELNQHIASLLFDIKAKTR